jgi:flagellar motor switch protein FliN
MFDNQLTDLLTRAQQGINALLSPDETYGGDANDRQQLDLRITLGRTRLQPDDVEKLRSGSVLLFDTPSSDPATIHAGGRLIGRGEVVVVGGKIGVRVTELVGVQKTT